MLKGLRKGSYRKNNRNGDGDIIHSDPEFGIVPSLTASHPAPLGLSLSQLNRKKQQKVLSNNAVHALYGGRRSDDDDASEGGAEGYALELYSDCGESVSSLNDSCFGGASVTGGYNIHSSPLKEAMTSPLKQATSLVVGVVPSLAVSDFPSFDTEDVSVLVDLEQPPSTQNGTMIPITGSLNIKRKGRSSAREAGTAKMASILDIAKPSGSPAKLLQPTDFEVEVSVTSNESFPCDDDFVPNKPTTITDTSQVDSGKTDVPVANKSKRTWLPICLQRAPFWLKILLLMGILLLLIATILVVLGLVLEFNSEKNQGADVSASSHASNLSPTTAPTTMTLPEDIFSRPRTPTSPDTPSPTPSPTRKGRAKTEVKTAAPSPAVVLSFDPNTVFPAPSSN